MDSNSDIDFGSDNSVADPTFEPKRASRRLNFSEPMETTTSDNSGTEKNISGVNDILFEGEFFKILEKRASTPYQKKMQGIIAKCQICSKKVKGSLRVSSNFIAHLRQKHPKSFKDFQKKKTENRKCFRLISSLDRDILDFICETCSPLSIIEQPSFLKLLAGRKIPSRRTITRLLAESHMESQQKLSDSLAKIEFLCTTADIWSGGKRSFFGYTCHWLDADTLERKSAALACRRFKGAHSFDRITDMICEINGQYKISVDKILYTITDNGSNFVKAFKEFGVILEREGTNEGVNEDDCDDDNQSEYSSPEFHNYSPTLSKHFRCASHTLNLLATTDFTKILEGSTNQAVRDIHKTTFNRCTKLWNKCNRPKSAEIIKSVLSSHLVTPCVTRWNSMYDSVRKLIEVKHKLSELCYKLDISKFDEEEIEYLEEYARIMEPIAEAIDFLQKEENMYFGYFVPTLVSIKIKLRRLASENLKFLTEISGKMESKLIERFEKYFYLHSDSWDAVIAATLIPEIKLQFCKVLLESANSYTIDHVRDKIKVYAMDFQKNTVQEENNSQASMRATKPFLEFDNDPKDTSQYTSSHGGAIATEVYSYLNEDDSNIDALRRFPTIRKMFLKYNTPLPSSAPVERLFSFAGIINRSKRQNLTDNNFEMLVLKKANKN